MQDDRLRLIFTCCHPALSPEARVALTLRLLGGLSTEDVARAFLVSEPTMAQRLVRAKHKIKAARIPYPCAGRAGVARSPPPGPEWFAGRTAVRGFFAWAWGPSGPGPFRLLETRANAQPAFGLYGRAVDGDGHTPQAIQVLMLESDRIVRLHGFVRPDLFELLGLPPRL